MKELNYGGDAPGVDISRLGELSEVIETMEARQEVVDRLEAELKEAKLALSDVQEHRGPELMDELRTKDFTTAGGVRVKVEEKLEHSLGRNDPARKARALRIMRDLKQGGAIRNVVVAEFAMGEDDKADALLAELRERGFVVTRDETIHPSTLKSILMQLLRSGVKVPELTETFGGYWRRKLKVVRKR